MPPPSGDLPSSTQGTSLGPHAGQPPPPRAQGLVAVRGPGDRTVPSPPSSAPWGGGRAPSPPPAFVSTASLASRNALMRRERGGPRDSTGLSLCPPQTPAKPGRGGPGWQQYLLGQGCPHSPHAHQPPTMGGGKLGAPPSHPRPHTTALGGGAQRTTSKALYCIGGLHASGAQPMPQWMVLGGVRSGPPPRLPLPHTEPPTPSCCPTWPSCC